MLQLQSLSKSFASSASPVLNEVDLSLEQGESLAVMGASGSGKSSLLNIIAGLIPADSGDVVFQNHSLRKMTDEARDRFRCLHFGMVFQQFNLIDCLNVRDNISLPARYLGAPYTKRLDELSGQLGIAHRVDGEVSTLSGGEQQRVAIARALIHSPELILADEPTGNLDTQTSDHVAELLFDTVKRSNAAMIIVTHSEDVAERADRIVQLRQGKLVSWG